MKEINQWRFPNGIKVIKQSFDYDLYCFEVYNNDEYLGTIYPSCIQDMHACVRDLNAGIDPITGSWEDGNGNTCSLDGWE